MSDRTAFYRAIWAAPDDDLPRLVFADYLDEHGDPDAAHFLRLLSAARTCPPDVDQLRPLVAELRRTMVKLPPEFIENACPVHPAVVVGPWVDVDHEANRGVLKWLRKERTPSWYGVRGATESASDKFDSANHRGLVPAQRMWEFIGPELSPAANCVIDEVPAVIDVWSGVVMAFSPNLSAHLLRVPIPVAVTCAPERWTFRTLGRHARSIDITRMIGGNWIRGLSVIPEADWVKQAAAEFDPANHPA